MIFIISIDTNHNNLDFLLKHKHRFNPQNQSFRFRSKLSNTKLIKSSLNYVTLLHYCLIHPQLWFPIIIIVIIFVIKSQMAKKFSKTNFTGKLLKFFYDFLFFLWFSWFSKLLFIVYPFRFLFYNLILHMRVSNWSKSFN